MKNENRAPCYQCPDRAPGCHGYCTLYDNWKRERKILKAERRLQRDNPDVVAYEIERSQILFNKKR